MELWIFQVEDEVATLNELVAFFLFSFTCSWSSSAFAGRKEVRSDLSKDGTMEELAWSTRSE